MPRKNRKSSSSRAGGTLNGASFKALAHAVYHCKQLAPGAISPAQFERILESARWTPSVANKQPWLLAGANGDAARGLLQHFAEHPRSFADFFASTSERDVLEDMGAAGALVFLLGQRTSPFWRESCLLATYQMLLATAAEGLAARALIPTSPNALAEIIRVPDEYLAFMLVLLGREGEPEIKTAMLKPLGDVSVALSTRIFPPSRGG